MSERKYRVGSTGHGAVEPVVEEPTKPDIHVPIAHVQGGNVGEGKTKTVTFKSDVVLNGQRFLADHSYDIPVATADSLHLHLK